ncbi:MAG TPA: EutN/CcmL family microcompartment protein [Clostridia bacterium]|nr:EutN/CcmL family microcompartment protein [Clostridia bacterium]
MKLARVVGNVVSTIKEGSHYGKKMLIVEYLDAEGNPKGARRVALDCVDAGIGDVVIVNTSGGCCNLLFEDKNLVLNEAVCGVVDHYTIGEQVFTGHK